MSLFDDLVTDAGVPLLQDHSGDTIPYRDGLNVSGTLVAIITNRHRGMERYSQGTREVQRATLLIPSTYVVTRLWEFEVDGADTGWWQIPPDPTSIRDYKMSLLAVEVWRVGQSERSDADYRDDD